MSSPSIESQGVIFCADCWIAHGVAGGMPIVLLNVGQFWCILDVGGAVLLYKEDMNLSPMMTQAKNVLTCVSSRCFQLQPPNGLLHFATSRGSIKKS